MGQRRQAVHLRHAARNGGTRSGSCALSGATPGADAAEQAARQGVGGTLGQLRSGHDQWLPQDQADLDAWMQRQEINVADGRGPEGGGHNTEQEASNAPVLQGSATGEWTPEDQRDLEAWMAREVGGFGNSRGSGSAYKSAPGCGKRIAKEPQVEAGGGIKGGLHRAEREEGVACDRSQIQGQQ